MFVEVAAVIAVAVVECRYHMCVALGCLRHHGPLSPVYPNLFYTACSTESATSTTCNTSNIISNTTKIMCNTRKIMCNIMCKKSTIMCNTSNIMWNKSIIMCITQVTLCVTQVYTYCTHANVHTSQYVLRIKHRQGADKPSCLRFSTNTETAMLSNRCHQMLTLVRRVSCESGYWNESCLVLHPVAKNCAHAYALKVSFLVSILKYNLNWSYICK